jgi:hypothetical protein
MCEILFRVHDKINDDPYLNVRCLKRGDAVAICADGWAWSANELTAPYWRIVALPNVTEQQAASFLAPELDADPQNPSRMLQRRSFKLDLSNITIPRAIKDWFTDDTRALGIRTISMDPSQFLALRVQKTPVPDPNILVP